VNQTRAKAAVRGAKVKSKSGRRPPVKVKSGPELPLLPIVVGGILVVLAIILIVLVIRSAQNTNAPVTGSVDGIPCDNLEHTQVHYHVALQIVYGGVVHPIPGAVGITPNESAPSCYFWMHVHSANTNTIHIEAPKSRTFTLGEFFDIWSKWSGIKQPLDATHVSSFTLTPDQSLVVYVDPGDGTGPKLYTGDPRAIVLRAHEVITLEVSPPTVAPPPSFTFATGL
jgi:hypothetical protein